MGLEIGYEGYDGKERWMNEVVSRNGYENLEREKVVGIMGNKW